MNLVRGRPKFIGIFVVATILCNSLPAANCGNSNRNADLKSLCQDKHSEITLRSQIRNLAEQLNSDQDNQADYKCSNRVRAALAELDQLVNDPDNNNACSLKHIEKVKEYNDKYISTVAKSTGTPAAAAAADQSALPKVLKNFFIGYGLKLSNVCKIIMISTLTWDGRKQLDQSDFDRLEPWTGDHSAISEIMNEPNDYDDLFLPRDLKRVVEDEEREQNGYKRVDDNNGDSSPNGNASGDDEKLFVQTANGHLTRQVQAICEHRFRPIYEASILPVIYLSNMGFNYRGEDLQREMQEMSVNKEVHQWYRIVYLCESLIGFEVVDGPQQDGELAKKVVRILTKEEAAELKKQDTSDDDDSVIVERIVYEPELVKDIGDEIIDLKQKSLTSLINSFATHKTELDIIRDRMLRKMAKFIFNSLRKNQFKIVGSIFGNGMKGAEQGSSSASSASGVEDMVEIIEEYVEDETNDPNPKLRKNGFLKRAKGKYGGVATRYYHQAAAGGLTSAGKKLDKAWSRSRVRRTFWYALSLLVFSIGLACVIGVAAGAG